MTTQIILGLTIPFLGTALGASSVFLIKDQLSEKLNKSLSGFAAGVMTAAAFWSLLNPSLEQCADMGRLAFLPATIGFAVGIGFLLLLDVIIPHLHILSTQSEGPKSNLKASTMMVLAVTLHNIPEGLAVGIVFASWLSGSTYISLAGALALSLGMALQNIPEGAVVSLPIANKTSKERAFFGGLMSGIVEPIFGVVTIIISSSVLPLMPYLQSFAAGAMFYVIVEELVPDMSHGKHSNHGVICFSLGFIIMMILGVVLG